MSNENKVPYLAIDAMLQQAQELGMGYPKSDYPSWICGECARLAGHRRMHIGIVATFHIGLCDVCMKQEVVTEPRDYGYPDVKIGQFSSRGVNE